MRHKAKQTETSDDLRGIIDAIPALIAYIDKSLHTRFLNQAFADWFGRSVEELQNLHIADILGSNDFACAQPYMQKALAGTVQKYERTLILASGKTCHVVASYAPHINQAGETLGFFALVSDVSELAKGRQELHRYRLKLEEMVEERTQELVQANKMLEEEIATRHRAEALLAAEKRAMEMICSGTSIHRVLQTLSETIESFSQGGLCSILVADKDEQTLLRDISPSLPHTFIQAIKEIPITADGGCSGSAAFFKQQVFAEDIASDPKWERYRDVALAHNIRSSWSMPIISSTGNILGTIALYYQTPQQPPQGDQQLVERITHLAAIAFEREQVASQLNYLATHDPLTHLSNRHLFQDSLSKALIRAQRTGSMFALLFIDLDRFKHVNDHFGHECGDELLKHVAKRLIGSVRQNDIVGRLGGDEFTILIEGIDKAKEAEDIARKLVRILSSRFHIGGNDLFISCSIGIALYPQHAQESHSLLKNADAAMYCAKSLGRNNYQMYAPYMMHGSTTPNMGTDLQTALELNQFVLYYQPQYDSAASTITSMEALIRWNHPQLGLLLPTEFLGFIEDSSLMIAIGKWVIRSACAQNKLWHDTGYHTRVAINVSAAQVKEPAFSDFVLETLESIGLPARYLALELTEDIVTHYDSNVFDNLIKLKKGGIYITVDDFGTGYSSLSYLKRLPIDGLKINQSFFTQDADADQGSGVIMTSLLELAKKLNLSITAQGVESTDQWTFLANHGCPHLQGFAISKPLSVDDLTQMFVGLYPHAVST